MEYTTASMDSLRPRGDDLAHATVAALFDRGDVARFNTLMRVPSSTAHWGAPRPSLP
jgi:hypothetical protein